jgi:F-type H+-transporting ATPase subunit a
LTLFFLGFCTTPLIFAANFEEGMAAWRLKSLMVAVFSILGGLVWASEPPAGDGHAAPQKKFNASEVIFGHVLNGHEFHFMDIDGHPISIPLPIFLYSPERGWTGFMSSHFEHGHKNHNGYAMLNEHSIHEMKLDPKKFSVGDIVAVNEEGHYDATVTVYDLSMTRNVVQMLIALILFVWIMLKVAARYKKGEGVKTAPSGMQGMLEPVITFVRDEVARPNLGHKAEKYLPYLLTVFFFILINNIFGLIPGSANVTGNIAFTAVLGVISMLVILFSSNAHFWQHIFNPPGVPFAVKFILVPVEFLGIFIKPFSLIIRLFANMVAGHIIIICLISLIFIFGELSAVAGWGASPLAIGFTVFIYLIEVLVAFLQAFIFTMLTAVFIGQAFEGEHHDEAHAAHH